MFMHTSVNIQLAPLSLQYLTSLLDTALPVFITFSQTRNVYSSFDYTTPSPKEISIYNYLEGW